MVRIPRRKARLITKHMREDPEIMERMKIILQDRYGRSTALAACEIGVNKLTARKWIVMCGLTPRSRSERTIPARPAIKDLRLKR